MTDVKKYITHVYGKRCKTRDLDDFPEMEHDPLATRCRACLEWERYDEFIAQLGKEEK